MAKGNAAAKQTDKIRKPVKEQPFPSGSKNGEGKTVDPRADQIADISDRFAEHRKQEQEEALANDPSLERKQRAIELAAGARELDPGESIDDNDDDPEKQVQNNLDDGVPSREIIDNEGGSEATSKEEVIGELPNYLSKHVELRDGKPVMKFNVDGQIVYKDLDKVVEEGQKYEAGSRRLREASEWSKQLQETQAALKQQLVSTNNNQTQNPPVKGDNAFDVKKAASELAQVMYSGTKEDAEAKLAETLSQLSQSAGPPVDADALINRATQAARQQLQQENFQREATRAWNHFQTNFEDVLNDDEAYLFADSIYGKLEKENPDWSVEQVISEAGKRAREVVIEGKKPPEPPPSDANRQANKESLTQIPQPRSTVQEPPKEEKPQTPHDILNDIRRARSQPV